MAINKQTILRSLFTLVIGFSFSLTASAATILSDDFTGTTIDTTKWVEYENQGAGDGGSTGNVQQNGSLTVVGGNWHTDGLESVDTFDRSAGDITIEVDMAIPACSNSGFVGALGYGTWVNDSLPAGTIFATVRNGNLRLYSTNPLEYVTATDYTCVDNETFHLKMVIKQAGGVDLFLNGSLTPNASLTSVQAPNTWNNKSISLQSYSTLIFDNLTVDGTTALPPEAPTSLIATPASNEIALSWTAPADSGSAITDYVVEYKLASEPTTWTVFADGTSDTTATTVTGLTNGVAYNLRVSAVNVNGTGDTTPVNGTPVSSTPTAPTSTSVAVAGLTSVGEQMIASYVFVDPNGDSEATSTYRWLSSDTAGGTYSPVVGATSINYTITSGDAGKYLKFEVTPVSNTSPTTGSPVLSSASSQVTETTLNHILSTGQSLSLGSKGGPALSTTQPYNNKMLNGSSLTALVESTLESMSSAMANTLTALSPNTDFQSAVTRHGAGSKSYTQLKKGTTLYADGLTQATNVKNAATALGLVAKVIAVTNIHGESDHVADNGADYQSYLEEWHSDYNTDVKVITGQTGDIPMITDQMSSQTGYDDATSLIPLAQLSASEDNPGDIILVGPKYYFTYADNAHLENTSYRWLGEYYGKVLKKVTLDNESWKPLSPDSITRSGNVIYADFHVPAGEIAFDTTLVSARTHYGFEYYDDTSSASISSVEILDDDTVKVTLSGTPTGADQRLRYAYTGVPGTQPGAQNTGSAAGNLRDTDSTPSLYGNTLYNWSVHFDKSITEDSVAPTPSSILSNPSNTTTDITWTTNEAGATIVDYGLTNSYGTSTTETNTSSRVLNHNVTLPSLFACTTYHYRVRSKDAAQNQGASTNKTFTTAGCTGGSEVTSESATSITGATGGTSTLSEISLNIPGGATGDAVYQIKALNKSTVLGSAGSPTGRTTVGNSVFDLKALTGTGTATTSFSNPIEVTLSYQDGDVIDMEESSLVIYRYDGTDWYSLAPCTVDTNLNTVTCSTSNFSVFGLFGTPPVSSGSSGSRSSSAKAQLAFAEYYAQKNAEATPTPDTQNTCSANQTLTQNLRAPSRNGVFNSYTQGIVTEAAILQGHLNRLGFNSGPEDGIIGPLTEGAIKRMQTFLGTIPDGYVGPITRGLLNESCGEGGLIS